MDWEALDDATRARLERLGAGKSLQAVQEADARVNEVAEERRMREMQRREEQEARRREEEYPSAALFSKSSNSNGNGSTSASSSASASHHGGGSKKQMRGEEEEPMGGDDDTSTADVTASLVSAPASLASHASARAHAEGTARGGGGRSRSTPRLGGHGAHASAPLQEEEGRRQQQQQPLRRPRRGRDWDEVREAREKLRQEKKDMRVARLIRELANDQGDKLMRSCLARDHMGRGSLSADQFIESLAECGLRFSVEDQDRALRQLVEHELGTEASSAGTEEHKHPHEHRKHKEIGHARKPRIRPENVQISYNELLYQTIGEKKVERLMRRIPDLRYADHILQHAVTGDHQSIRDEDVAARTWSSPYFLTALQQNVREHGQRPRGTGSTRWTLNDVQRVFSKAAGVRMSHGDCSWVCHALDTFRASMNRSIQNTPSSIIVDKDHRGNIVVDCDRLAKTLAQYQSSLERPTPRAGLKPDGAVEDDSPYPHVFDEADAFVERFDTDDYRRHPIKRCYEDSVYGILHPPTQLTRSDSDGMDTRKLTARAKRALRVRSESTADRVSMRETGSRTRGLLAQVATGGSSEGQDPKRPTHAQRRMFRQNTNLEGAATPVLDKETEEYIRRRSNMRAKGNPANRESENDDASPDRVRTGRRRVNMPRRQSVSSNISDAMSHHKHRKGRFGTPRSQKQANDADDDGLDFDFEGGDGSDDDGVEDFEGEGQGESEDESEGDDYEVDSEDDARRPIGKPTRYVPGRRRVSGSVARRQSQDNVDAAFKAGAAAHAGEGRERDPTLDPTGARRRVDGSMARRQSQDNVGQTMYEPSSTEDNEDGNEETKSYHTFKRRVMQGGRRQSQSEGLGDTIFGENERTKQVEFEQEAMDREQRERAELQRLEEEKGPAGADVSVLQQQQQGARRRVKRGGRRQSQSHEMRLAFGGDHSAAQIGGGTESGIETDDSLDEDDDDNDEEVILSDAAAQANARRHAQLQKQRRRVDGTVSRRQSQSQNMMQTLHWNGENEPPERRPVQRRASLRPMVQEGTHHHTTPALVYGSGVHYPAERENVRPFAAHRQNVQEKQERQAQEQAVANAPALTEAQEQQRGRSRTRATDENSGEGRARSAPAATKARWQQPRRASKQGLYDRSGSMDGSAALVARDRAERSHEVMAQSRRHRCNKVSAGARNALEWEQEFTDDTPAYRSKPDPPRERRRDPGFDRRGGDGADAESSRWDKFLSKYVDQDMEISQRSCAAREKRLERMASAHQEGLGRSASTHDSRGMRKLLSQPDVEADGRGDTYSVEGGSLDDADGMFDVDIMAPRETNPFNRDHVRTIIEPEAEHIDVDGVGADANDDSFVSTGSAGGSLATPGRSPRRAFPPPRSACRGTRMQALLKPEDDSLPPTVDDPDEGGSSTPASYSELKRHRAARWRNVSDDRVASATGHMTKTRGRQDIASDVREDDASDTTSVTPRAGITTHNAGDTMRRTLWGAWDV